MNAEYYGWFLLFVSFSVNIARAYIVYAYWQASAWFLHQCMTSFATFSYTVMAQLVLPSSNRDYQYTSKHQ